MLYNTNDAMFCLGCLCNNPSLLLNDKYRLDKSDFSPDRFHLIIYATIKKLYVTGVNDMNEIIIDQFLQNYPAEYELVSDKDLLDFIPTIKELAKEENIEYYYNNVRKYSMLREYKEQGFDITEIYDENQSEESQRDNLNKYSINEIINYFDKKQNALRRKFSTNLTAEEYQAGFDFDSTKEQMKLNPLMGDSFQSEYLNSIFRGMMGFILRCGQSGGGKTTLSVGDICKLSAKEYWDSDRKEWVINKSRAGNALFINTEMDLRTELDPKFIAWISDVPMHKILDGEYTKEEEDRLDRASAILKDSGIYIVDDPEFTTKSLTSTIAYYAEEKDVKNVCFDYIANNGWVAKELSSETKVPQREDMVLLTITDRLKQASRKYHVNILSGTQLNGNEREQDIIDERCLAGGKSQVRKTDGTMIILEPKAKEMEMIKPLLERTGLLTPDKTPNMVTHIVKGRASKYPKHIKVYQYVDLGTGRVKDLFCTTRENEKLVIEKTVVENKDWDIF